MEAEAPRGQRDRRLGLEAPAPDVDWSKFDFIDLGASRGSVRHCSKRWRGRGIGINTDPEEIAEIRANGYRGILADPAKLDAEKAVRFVSMMSFLEQLPDLQAVEDMIARAARAATDFLFIRHPSYEGEELAPYIGFCPQRWMLERFPAHIHVADYCAMFERLGIGPYSIRYFGPVTHTSHPSVIPIGLPPNLDAAAAAAYPRPPDVALPGPWWQRQDIFVALKKYDPNAWARLTRPFGREAEGHGIADL